MASTRCPPHIIYEHSLGVSHITGCLKAREHVILIDRLPIYHGANRTQLKAIIVEANRLTKMGV